jgi:hypothetical protein
MTIKHPPEIIAQLEAQALHVPHGLFVADRILDLEIGAFISTITFAHTPPNGSINPVATVQMPTPLLKALADKIDATFTGRADELASELNSFATSVRKP